MRWSNRWFTDPTRIRFGRSLLAATALVFFLSALAALAQTSTNATNSTVRFRLAYGITHVGDIDVELFDSDKPITVSNFLAYAQAGKYSRSYMHRLVPGFVLVGGGFTVPAPYAAAPFQQTTVIPANPPITNEFNVGTPRSNVFGMLAMNKVPGQPNSATSQWFFNLGDNSRGTGATNLNTDSGGYTVFGRVTAGASVLQALNGRGIDDGIVNMQSTVYQTFCSPVVVNPDGVTNPFGALPVRFSDRFACVNYSDLLSVEVVILNARDVLPPTLTVTAPTENASLTNEHVSVRGTASDNVGVAGVQIFRGTNLPVAATVTNGTWTLVLTNTPPGTNAILVEATDTSGLRSRVVRTFFRSLRTPLTLLVEGFGTVSGATDQQQLEIGRGYKLTAKPARGNLFGGWTGDLVSENPTISFLMSSNLSITARFATNLFPFARGAYAGLFHNATRVEQESSGFVSLTLTDSGAYSAKILMNGRTYPMKGVFAPDGTETNLVTRAGTNSLLVTLALDLTNGTDQLTGTITNNQVTAIDTNRSWSADLVADRAVFNAVLRPAPQAGRYTLLVPPDPASTAGPPADGYGALTVTTKGSLAFSGVLADGTKVSQKTGLSKNGAWPLYVSLAKGRGALVSWLTLTNETATDLSGLLNWFKQSQAGVRYYNAGLTNESFVIGSRFIPPTTNRVLELTAAVVGFTNGNLVADFANDIVLGADGKAVNQDSNPLKLTISRSTGLFTGSVTPPGATKAIPFKGAVLQQKGNRGAGFFLGTNSAGSVILAE